MVEIAWQLVSAPGQRLVVRWTESGGPPVSSPTRHVQKRDRRRPRNWARAIGDPGGLRMYSVRSGMVLSIGDLAGPPASPAGSAQLWLSAGGNIHIGWGHAWLNVGSSAIRAPRLSIQAAPQSKRAALTRASSCLPRLVLSQWS